MFLSNLHSWLNRKSATAQRRHRKGNAKPTPQRPKRLFQPQLEALEDRTLLAVSVGVTFDDGSGPMPELPVTSYSWGAAGSPSASPSLKDFALVVEPDSVEPGLWGHLAAGKHLDSATLQISKDLGGREPQVYLTYTLSNVTISSFTTSWHDHTAAPQDLITLHFDQVTEAYRPIDPDGTLGASNTAAYDQATATSGAVGSLQGQSTRITPGLTFVEDGVTLHGSDLSSYSWGATASPSAAPSLQDFTLALVPSSVEPGLWGHLAAGKHLDSTTIQIGKMVNGEDVQYLTYTLSNVTISSFTTSWHDGNPAPRDTITLHFDQVTEAYRPINPDGTLGAPNTAAYDQASATSGGAGSLQGQSTRITPALTFVEDGVTLHGSDLSSYSWGATASPSAAPSLQEFTLALESSSVEPGLWGHLAAGKHLDSATLQIGKMVNGEDVQYLTYTLSNVTISSFTTTTSEFGGLRPQNLITLHFDQVTEAYRPIDSDGTLGAPNTAAYDQASATSGGAGSLQGQSTRITPALTFVEDGVTLHGSDLSSYSWGATASSSGAPNLQDFTLELEPSSAEPGLWGHLAAGKHLDSATLQIGKMVNGEEVQYLTYTLSNVTISSFTTRWHSHSSVETEDTITLHFDQVTEAYRPIDPDGTLGAPNTAAYDQASATSGGAGSLRGQSTRITPALTFVEDGVTLRGSDVASYIWGASASPSAAPSLQDFTFTLESSSVEPGLWGHLAAGKHLDSATLQIGKMVNGEQVQYLTYTLSNVTISSFTTSAHPNDIIGSAPFDTITLHFDQVTEAYRPINPDGTLGAPNTAAYDQASATSGGAGSLQGESHSFTPALTFVEDGVTLRGSDLASYTWGATASPPAAPSLKDFTLVVDSSSMEPGLWGHLAAGKHLDSATIQVSKDDGGRVPQVYLTYTLSNVTISSFTTAAHTNSNFGAAPQDLITLHFDQVTEAYRPIDPDGILGAPNTAAYNRATATSGGAGGLGAPAPIATTIALTTSRSSTVYGAPVVFTAVVSPVAPGALAPTGFVDFFDGTTDISGPITLTTVGGRQVASFTTNTLSAATHTITASYVDPTENYAGSSGATSQVVNPDATSTVVSSSPGSPWAFGQPVVFTAVVSANAPGGGTPTGPVQFVIDGMNFGSPVPLSSAGTASVTLSSLGVGSHTVLAVYAGDSNFYGSAAPPITQVILGSGVTVVGTELFAVGGSATNDQVQLNPAGPSTTGSTGVQVKAVLNGAKITTTFSQAFSVVRIFGYAGNVNIQLADSLTVTAVITLGDGNDTIKAGGGNIQVTLGDGNDKVTLGNGNNDVTLGNGNNVVTLGNGNNVVVTGNGNNNIQAGNGNNLIAAGLGHHNAQVGNGRNILIDGSVALTGSGDSLRQVLNDWIAFGTAAAARIRSRLAVTYNTSHANKLSAGSGLDWFWAIYALDKTNRKATDLLN